MKKQLKFLCGLLLLAAGGMQAAEQQPEWQSQYAFGLNKIEPHSYVWPYK